MEKKHLAILCGVFFPNPSATGQCVKRFSRLLSEEFDIDIICLSNDYSICDVELEQGIHIHTISCHRMSVESHSKGLCKSFLHLIGCINIKTLLLGNMNWYRKAALRKLEELHQVKSFDAVFSVCSPFAAHLAAKDFKLLHPSIRWCGYTVDPYSSKNRIRPIWCSYNRLVEYENKTLCAMDSALLSEEVFKNRPEIFNGTTYSEKLPYLLPDTVLMNNNDFFENTCINCVYAGSFYRDIRNPEYMLKIFSSIDNSLIKLHLFCSGCEEIIRKYADNKSIVVHPRIPAEDISLVYQSADFLVNIGNTSTEFVPSKTFEYISTGKPIIDFFYDGFPNEALFKYPLCCHLQINDNSKNDQTLLDFIKNNSNKCVSIEEIEKIYSNHSRNSIHSILRRNLFEGV